MDFTTKIRFKWQNAIFNSNVLMLLKSRTYNYRVVVGSNYKAGMLILISNNPCKLGSIKEKENVVIMNRTGR